MQSRRHFVLKQQRHHGRLNLILSVFLISISVICTVQAQTAPWPTIEFEVESEWNKYQLERDLHTAARFYEKNNFLAPNLELIELESPHPAAGSYKYPIYVMSNLDDPDAQGVYNASQACMRQILPPNERRSARSNRLPDITISTLQYTIPLIQAIALPHELFHAIQFAYPSVLKQCDGDASGDHGTNAELWLIEGMADAMALDWLKANRSGGQVDGFKQSRVRGWRNYRAPLAVTEEWETYGYEAQVRKPLQAYKTSSFWRYLGPDLIRAVLEYDGVTRNMDALDWLDEALQEEWTGICKKAFPGGVPRKQDNIPCEDASEYAGLYLMYPMFITKFAETERYKGDMDVGDMNVGDMDVGVMDVGGLDVIFSDTGQRGVGLEERGSGRRQEGCLVVEPGILSPPLNITLQSVAAECLRVPAEHTGKLFVHVKILGEQNFENLILGWNGCVQSLGSVMSLSDSGPSDEQSTTEKTKVWPVHRDIQAGINGCKKLKPGEDLLMVLSNVAPKASDTEPMQVQLRLLQDED